MVPTLQRKVQTLEKKVWTVNKKVWTVNKEVQIVHKNIQTMNEEVQTKEKIHFAGRTNDQVIYNEGNLYYNRRSFFYRMSGMHARKDFDLLIEKVKQTACLLHPSMTNNAYVTLECC